MAILLSGCSKTSDNKTSNAHQKEPEKTLIIAINNDENSLTPFNYVSGTGLIVNRLIYDTLLTQDKDGKIIPWMVEDDYQFQMTTGFSPSNSKMDSFFITASLSCPKM